MQSQQKIKLLSLFGAIFAFLALSGCKTLYSPVSEETVSGMKRVGVVSVTARVFTRQYIGLTVFTSEIDQIDIRDWKLDEHYENLIRSELQKSFGIVAVKAAYSADEFEQVGTFIDPWSAPLVRSATVDVNAVVKSYCAANAVDGILLVVKELRGDGQTNQSLVGAGAYMIGNFQKKSVIHLVSRVDLLDCISAKRVVSKWLSTDQVGPMSIGGMFGDRRMRGVPTYYLDMKTATTPIKQWSPEQLQDARTKLVKIVDQAIPTTLRSIFSVKPTAVSIAK